MRGRNLVYFSRLSLHYHDFLLLLLSFFRLSLSVFAFASDHLFLVGKGGGRKASERASSVLLVLLPFLFHASSLLISFPFR